MKMKPDQTVFTENKINLMVVIRISRSPSVVVKVEAQKMSLRSSVLYRTSHSSLLFTYKNFRAARWAPSESTNWNLKTTLGARYWYVNAQTQCWAVFTLVIERHKHYDLTSRYVVLWYSWNFFLLTARALIGYLEVTWLLTVKLFPAKNLSGQHHKFYDIRE